MKQILLVFAILGFNCASAIAELKDVTSELASVRCVSIFEGQENEVAQGLRNKSDEPLVITASFTDAQGQRKTSSFTLVKAQFDDANAPYPMVIQAQGQAGSLRIEYNDELEENPGDIWFNQIPQDYLKLVCSGTFIDAQ